MGTLAINVDLITGWFPLTVVIVAIASVVCPWGGTTARGSSPPAIATRSRWRR